LFGELLDGPGGPFAGGNGRGKFRGEGGGHAFDLEIDGVVFHAPGAALGPAGVDHAVDEVDFDAVAGSEAAHVALAITVELADVLGEDDEVGGA
jgi:hypothetical protein